MQKVAIITSKQDIDWVSCKSISANLLESYTLALNSQCQLFYINGKDTTYSHWRVASDVRAWGAEKLIFIDHAPCPANFINILHSLDPYYRPNLIVHVYGDFILKANDWIAAEAPLAELSIHWICASKKQAALLKKFVSEENSKIDICPFPVSTKEYYFEKNLRVNFRKKLALVEDDQVFLYTGRLSLQKNIMALIRAFNFYQKNINPNAVLLMAGPIDDLGMPYLGKTSPEGLMAYDIQTLINALFSTERRDRIQYLGNFNSQTLNSIYNAADLFISLSTHNDEDFGMAPAEALLTGLPCVLTDWAGYSGFKDSFPSDIKYIPTQIGDVNTIPDQKLIISALVELNITPSTAQREQIAAIALQNHSVHACAKKIKYFLSQEPTHKFKRFTSVFHSVADVLSVNPRSPFGNASAFSNLYREIYSVYPS